jgi:hypothetical protein
MTNSPMFPNFISRTLGLNKYSQKFQKNHGERSFFPQQEGFFRFALRYFKRELLREKERHFGPLADVLKARKNSSCFQTMYGYCTFSIFFYVRSYY